MLSSVQLSKKIWPPENGGHFSVEIPSLPVLSPPLYGIPPSLTPPLNPPPIPPPLPLSALFSAKSGGGERIFLKIQQDIGDYNKL